MSRPYYFQCHHSAATRGMGASMILELTDGACNLTVVFANSNLYVLGAKGNVLQTHFRVGVNVVGDRGFLGGVFDHVLWREDMAVVFDRNGLVAAACWEESVVAHSSVEYSLEADDAVVMRARSLRENTGTEPDAATVAFLLDDPLRIRQWPLLVVCICH